MTDMETFLNSHLTSTVLIKKQSGLNFPTFTLYKPHGYTYHMLLYKVKLVDY